MKRIFVLFAIVSTIFVSAQEIPAEKIYRTTEVDSKPNLQDGMYKLTMFISDNFKFPEIKNKKIVIFTSFIIDTDGTMKDEKAFYISVKDYMPSDVVSIQTEEQKAAETLTFNAMKSEAARILGLFNEKWIPAKVGGKPVKCLYNYPITFNIE